MGTLLTIAWRNVWRHGKRTALTVVTMAFGLGFYIMVDSLLKGMDRGGLENILTLTDSSVRVSSKAYEEQRSSFPLEHGLSDPAALEAEARRDPRVVATTFRTRFFGRLSNGVDAIPVMAVAVDPARDAEVFDLEKFARGVWFGAGAERRIVLGRSLAADLGVEVGDWVTLAARTRWEARNADDFLVSALIDSSEPNINASGVYISFADAEDFLELEGLRTEMAVRMAERAMLADMMAESDQLAAALSARFPDAEAKSFGEVGRQFLEISKMKAKGTGVIIAVFLLIAGVGIANTVLMSVYARVREIGILRAFGLRPKDISRLFLLEGAMIGAVGSAAGVLVGFGLVAYCAEIGYPVDKMMGNGASMGMPIWGTLYGEWNPGTMAVAAVFGVAVALFSSRFPAKRAARMEVTDALRFV